MKRVSPRWYEWSRYSPALRLDEHGHFLAGTGGEPGVVIDPVPFQEGDEAQIRELGGAQAVVLTGPGRGREADRCAALLGCPVIAAHDGNEGLPVGLLAIALPAGDGGRGEEVALYHKETSTALVGARVVGDPTGALSLSLPGVPRAPVGDVPPIVAAGEASSAHDTNGLPARTARALRQLVGYGRVETLVVGAGASLVQDAARALQDLVFRHDPLAMVLRPDELRWTPAEGMRLLGARFGSRYAECARPLGLRVLDFELVEVPPGRQGGQRHRHDGQEELFVVLEGAGELVTEHAAIPVRAGDVVGFAPRYQIAHAFRNTGEQVLRYLAFGAFAETLEMVDYVESGVRAEFARFGKRHRFRLPEERDIQYWEGVPTD